MRLKMKVMKKMRSIVAITIAFGIGSSVFSPRQADAAFTVMYPNPISALWGVGTLLSVVYSDCNNCTFWNYLPGTLFGLFLLDQKLVALPSLDKQDLLDNGYSSAQVDRVLADASKLNEKLAKEKQVISLGDHETKASIRDELKNISPDASKEFLDVFSQRLFLAYQAKQNAKDSRMTESNVKPSSGIPSSRSASAEPGVSASPGR